MLKTTPRRLAAAGVAALLALGVAGCEPERPTTRDGHQAQPPDPRAAQPQPEKDPGTCVDNGDHGKARDVELRADWHTETRKAPDSLIWIKNGTPTTVTGLVTHKGAPGMKNDGEWYKIVSVSCGDVLSIKFRGGIHIIGVDLMIIDAGGGPIQHGDGHGNADISYVVP